MRKRRFIRIVLSILAVTSAFMLAMGMANQRNDPRVFGVETPAGFAVCVKVDNAMDCDWQDTYSFDGDFEMAINR